VCPLAGLTSAPSAMQHFKRETQNYDRIDL
jgi:hypothetical protein